LTSRCASYGTSSCSSCRATSCQGRATLYQARSTTQGRTTSHKRSDTASEFTETTSYLVLFSELLAVGFPFSSFLGRHQTDQFIGPSHREAMCYRLPKATDGFANTHLLVYRTFWNRISSSPFLFRSFTVALNDPPILGFGVEFYPMAQVVVFVVYDQEFGVSRMRHRLREALCIIPASVLAVTQRLLSIYPRNVPVFDPFAI
jgi:hypothetical protein